jgi:hypothetical protein
MPPINPQTLIEDLWVPLLLSAGLLVMSTMLWKSLDPARKLTRRDYQILLLFTGFMTVFLYGVIFHKYATWLWDFSAVGFITVLLIFVGILAGLVWATVRLRARSLIPAEGSSANRTIVQPSPGLRRWQIAVIVWASFCILGTLLAILIK